MNGTRMNGTRMNETNNRVYRGPATQDHRDDRAGASTAPTVAPRKRTLTMKLAGKPSGAATAVGHEPTPADAALQMKRAAETARWVDAAMRPDLCPAPVQRKGAGDASGGQLPSDGGGHAMPQPVQARMEEAFGVDFSAVRIHEGPRAHALGARAYTQGTEVHFAPGEYQPGSQSGQELLGHELAHVVQQSHGRVQATAQRKGLGVNDDSALEAEADAMGARAARGERVGGGASSAGPAAASSGAGVQLARLPAGPSQPAIQRAALAHDKLNVVGEDHDECRDHRPRERALLQEKTGATGFWLEQEFRVDIQGVHGGNESDTQQADPSLERTRHVLAEFAFRLRSAFSAYQAAASPIGDEEFDRPFREDDVEKRKALHAATEDVYKQLDDTIGQELHKHLYYLKRQDWPETKIAPVVKIVDLIAQLKSMTSFARDAVDKKAVKNTLAWIKETGAELVEQCKQAKWISEGDTTAIFATPGAVQDDSRVKRSRGMHAAGNRNANVLGMWKIGEEHVADIKDLTNRQQVAAAGYNLLTKGEFGEIYDQRYGKGKD